MRAILRPRPQPRRNDGLILLDPSEAGKLLAHYSTSGPGALRVDSTCFAWWFTRSNFYAQLKRSFSLLIFAVVIDRKQICSVGRSVGRSRSLSGEKPKVNFVVASSCECGMEISAALSRLSISFSSQRDERRTVLSAFPHVPQLNN